MGEVQSVVVVIKGSRWKVSTEGQSVEYEMSGALPFVRHAIRLLTERHGFVLDSKNTAQAFACHRARLLAERYGVAHP